MHRPIGRYRRSKQLMTLLELVADTTLNLTFCTNDVPFATGNKQIVFKDVSDFPYFERR